MSAHTPGPWKIEIYDSEAFILNTGDAAPQGITSVRLKYAGLRYDESLANARLIAAAPELLTALEDLTARLQAYRSPSDLSQDGFACLGITSTAARAAIAKARA